MNEVLQETVTGESPVTVTLGAKDYLLAFPLHACALYQRETAKLDRARSAERGALTAEEIRDFKEQRRILLRQADAVQDEIAALPKGAPHADKLDAFYELLGEAMLIKNRLDENGGRGDSLFLEGNWFKITTDDPERIVLALWAGLHCEQDRQMGMPVEPKWVPQLSVAQLRRLVDPSNAEEMIDAIGRALRAYAVKKKRSLISPNPGESANASAAATMTEPTSPTPLAFPGSGASPASTSDSPNPSS